ncbi:MAG: hypothetical protein Q9221_007781 [Calogaya cf. arnoldii]
MPITTEPASHPFSVSGASNLTKGLKAIDPRFSGHVAVPGRERLALDDGLMALTKMMHRLSGLPFNGMIGPETWVATGYTSVSVRIRVLPGREVIPTRFAIWGAQQLGLHVLWHKTVPNLVWALTWLGSLIGYIEFKRNSLQLLLPENASDDKSDATPVAPGLDLILDKQFQAVGVSGDNRKDINIVLPVLRDDRKLSLTYYMVEDQPMTKWELFANIYSLLGAIGEHPPRQKVLTYFVVSPTLFPDTHFQIKPVNDVEVEYRFLADAAISIAFFILRRNAFFTLLIRLQLDEEDICNGLIYKGDIPRPESSGS